MNYRNKSTTLGAGLVVLTTLLAGCGGGGSVSGSDIVPAAAAVENPINVTEASLVSAASKVTGGIVARNGGDFSFPEITGQGATLSMTIPNSPPPEFAARRTVISGTDGKIGFGDPVMLKYDMFSWSTGELVESSSQFFEALTVKAGVSDSVPIPEYLAKSLLGRSLGDTVQVVLPIGTEDLPAYLDATDAYVLLVELI